MEAVWATALGRSEGLSRPWPSAVFLLALAASMSGLAYAMKTVPVATAYALWVGIGAAVTICQAMATGEQPVSSLRILLLAALVGCVLGLRLAP